MKLSGMKWRIVPFVLYRATVVPRQVFAFILVSFASHICPKVDWNGIRLMCEPGQQERLGQIVSALELLQRTDPHRFRRVQRFIKQIVLFRWRYRGRYCIVGQICGIRPVHHASLSEEPVIHLYASVLIHEATHGLLEGLRFPYSKKNKKRIERICLAEQTRFLSTFPSALPRVIALIRNEQSGKGVKEPCR
jgi:hypothetical protein